MHHPSKCSCFLIFPGLLRFQPHTPFSSLVLRSRDLSGAWPRDPWGQPTGNFPSPRTNLPTRRLPTMCRAGEGPTRCFVAAVPPSSSKLRSHTLACLYRYGSCFSPPVRPTSPIGYDLRAKASGNGIRSLGSLGGSLASGSLGSHGSTGWSRPGTPSVGLGSPKLIGGSSSFMATGRGDASLMADFSASGRYHQHPTPLPSHLIFTRACADCNALMQACTDFKVHYFLGTKPSMQTAARCTWPRGGGRSVATALATRRRWAPAATRLLLSS